MNELEIIKQQIGEFETFKNDTERQQLRLPLDKNSLDVIHKDVVIQQGDVVAYDSVSYTEPIEVMINGTKYNLESTPEY